MKFDEDQAIIIRPASLDEAPIVFNLWLGSAKWLQAKNIDQWNPVRFALEHVIEYMNSGSDVYLAVMNNEFVGTYLITWEDPFIWKELDDSESGYIHRFAVSRQFKGMGIGIKLLRIAEEQIRSKGKKHIRLDCMADNERINQYYRDAEFQYVRRMDEEGWSVNLYEKK